MTSTFNYTTVEGINVCIVLDNKQVTVLTLKEGEDVKKAQLTTDTLMQAKFAYKYMIDDVITGEYDMMEYDALQIYQHYGNQVYLF